MTLTGERQKLKNFILYILLLWLFIWHLNITENSGLNLKKEESTSVPMIRAGLYIFSSKCLNLRSCASTIVPFGLRHLGFVLFVTISKFGWP